MREIDQAMNRAIKDVLWRELTARGFRADGTSPNDTIRLDQQYLDDIELAELFETMVCRREKVFGSSAVVGHDVSRRSYDDVVLAIEAIRVALRCFLPK